MPHSPRVRDTEQLAGAGYLSDALQFGEGELLTRREATRP